MSPIFTTKLVRYGGRKHNESNYCGFMMINIARGTDEQQSHDMMRYSHNRLL